MPTSSPHRKTTWFETQKRRKKNPFFRLLRHSFGFRLLIASLISLGILGLVHRFETCNQAQFSDDCLSAQLGDVITVGNVESFSIITAAWMYILESSKRKQQSNLEALEIINNTQGRPYAIARIEALEMAGATGIYFDYLNLEGCNLEQLEIPYTRLRHANLAGAVLKGADLRYTDLQNADLSQADLTEANLTGADLTQANLTGADLTGANLTGANLEGADLTSARLENTLLPTSDSSTSPKT
ncbi:MAG: pentapeptide repeat-containing protein [Cyanobacteriota bacterium]|nr:pentapeptide repeat-containing protein [Cyanobacteriota bacterium]